MVHFNNCKQVQENQNNQQQEIQKDQNYQEEREARMTGGRGQVGSQQGQLAALAEKLWRPHYRSGDEESGAIVCYADNSSSSNGDLNLEE